MNIEFKKAAHNLDKILAILGLAFALTLILTSLIIGNAMYAVVGIILLFACIAYLSIGKDEKLSSISQLPRTRSLYLLLNILFFSALLFSILSLYLQPDPYARPLSYFISIIMMVGILTVEILFIPRSKPYTYFLLTKIILIPLSLVWSYSLMFPTVIGADQAFHQLFTEGLMDSGFIPEGYVYSRLPIMHLMSGFTSLVTSLDYKMVAMFTSSIQLISLLLLLFLLGRFIFNAEVGLLAALLLGISARILWWYSWGVPFAFATVPVFIIVFLLFKVRRNNALVAASLAILLMATVIFTHPLTSMWMMILLFTFWIGTGVFEKIYNKKLNKTVQLSTVALFTVGMIGWWMYASGNLTHLVEALKWGYSVDFRPEGQITIPQHYIQSIPFGKSLFNSIGHYFILGISLPGCFYMLSYKVKNPYAFNIAVGGLIIFALIFFGSVFQFSFRIFGYRWEYFAMIFLSLPVAVSLYLFSMRIKRKFIKTSFLTFVVVALSLLMIMSPLANQDNPLFKDTALPRAAFTMSELQAVETILELTDQDIVTDTLAAAIYPIGRWTGSPQALRRISETPKNEAFYDKDFTSYKNYIIMLRREISQSPITFIEGPSAVNLDYDPAQFLTQEGWSRVYNSGSVSAFSKP